MSKNDQSIKPGTLAKALTVPAIRAAQGNVFIYYFVLPASKIWEAFAISRKQDGDDATYQRILSAARVSSVTRYIQGGNCIPGPIIVSLDKAKFNENTGQLTISAGKNVGWILDGQHRLAGAHNAAVNGTEIELGVAAFVDLTEGEEIKQFITINTEAKSVPKSLLLDLLKVVPPTKQRELAEARAVDVIDIIRADAESVFYNRIAVVSAPTKGQVSLTNFVRKILPIVHPEKGSLRLFPMAFQAKAIENYFVAFSKVFPKEWSKVDSVFFKTVGFGAILNAFNDVFEMTRTNSKGFRVKDIVSTLEPVSDFQFEKLAEYGSGNKAEMAAAQDFLSELRSAAFDGDEGEGGLDIPL